MIRFMVVMVAIVFLIVAVTKHNWPEALLFALSVCGTDTGNAADDCDGEPFQGAIAMSKKKVIVKRLNSIQNFGAIDILCTTRRAP